MSSSLSAKAKIKKKKKKKKKLLKKLPRMSSQAATLKLLIRVDNDPEEKSHADNNWWSRKDNKKSREGWRGWGILFIYENEDNDHGYDVEEEE